MPAKGQYKKGAKLASRKKRAFNARPEQKRRRAERNKSRRVAIEEKIIRPGDNRDIDHVDFNTSNESRSNLRAMDKHKNRARNQWAKRKRRGR